MAPDDQAWPGAPREPGPWQGGPPVAPPGNTALPPLPGAGGVVHNGPATANPWATAPGSQPPFGGPAPYPGAPPTGPLIDRASRGVVALAALVVVAFIAGGAYVVTRDSGPSYPSEWDPRVAEIAAWVEQDRNLTFEHPVDVQFLSPEEYKAVSTGTDDSVEEPSAEDASEEDEANADQVAQLRALGFLSGEVDLGAATDTLSDSGTLAFYSPETEMVYVRGTDLTPALRVTLAHELTHVLQDQAFDLSRVSDTESGQAGVLRALAEGDATRVEDHYVADVLTDDERDAYEEQTAADGASANEELEGKVPPVLSTVFAAPYVLGPELVAALDEQGGDEAIDGALADPPSEEVLFDPAIYDTPAADPITVTIEAPDGAEEIDGGEFGPTTLYLMLATRLEPKVALQATDGWGGDQYVVYREDDTVCVSLDVRADTTEDLTELGAALEAWSADSPDGTASQTVDGDLISFKTCDPGPEAPATGNEAAVDLLVLPVLRTQAYAQVLGQGGNEEDARCYGQGLVDTFTVEQLTGEDDYLSTAEGQAAITELATGCT